jgi:uroporphyrinogen-III synthase
MEQFTHLLLSSRSCVEHLCRWPKIPWERYQVLAVGQATARASTQVLGCDPAKILSAAPETAEGMCTLLESLNPLESQILYPHSALSRPLLREALQARGLKHCERFIYTSEPVEDEELLCDGWTVQDGFVFTSPSTVHAFVRRYGCLPKLEQCQLIGPITAAAFTAQSQQERPD